MKSPDLDSVHQLIPLFLLINRFLCSCSSTDSSVPVSRRPSLAASCPDGASSARLAQPWSSSHGSEHSRPAGPSPDSARPASSFSHATAPTAKRRLVADSSWPCGAQRWPSSERTDGGDKDRRSEGPEPHAGCRACGGEGDADASSCARGEPPCASRRGGGRSALRRGSSR